VDRVTITLDRKDANEMMTALTYGANALAGVKDRALHDNKPGIAHVNQEMEANLNKLYGIVSEAVWKVTCDDCESRPGFAQVTCPKCGFGCWVEEPECPDCW